jgi:hypothetical protein
MLPTQLLAKRERGTLVADQAVDAWAFVKLLKVSASQGVNAKTPANEARR